MLNIDYNKVLETKPSLLVDLLSNIDEINNPKSFYEILNVISKNLNKEQVNEFFITKNYNTLMIEKPFNVLYNQFKKFNDDEWVNKIWDLLDKLKMDFNSPWYYISFEDVEEKTLSKFMNKNFESISDFIEKVKEIKDISFTERIDVFDVAINYNEFFLKKHLRDNGVQKTIEKILERDLLHTAISSGNLQVVHFICNELNISINQKNKNGTPAITLCVNDSDLKELLKYKPNLLEVDANGNDALFSFNQNSQIDGDVCRKMIKISESYIKENPKLNKSTKYENSEDRIKETFINMVELNKSKADLVSFLKLNNLDDFKKLKNKEGKSLAYIMLEKGNWKRFDFFYDKNISGKDSYKNGNIYINYILNNTRQWVNRDSEFSETFGRLILDAKDDVKKEWVEYINNYDFNQYGFGISRPVLRTKIMQEKLKKLKFFHELKNVSESKEYISAFDYKSYPMGNALALNFLLAEDLAKDIIIKIDFKSMFKNSDPVGLFNLMALNTVVESYDFYEFSNEQKSIIESNLNKLMEDFGNEFVDHLNSLSNEKVVNWKVDGLKMLMNSRKDLLNKINPNFDLSLISEEEVQKELSYVILKNKIENNGVINKKHKI